MCSFSGFAVPLHTPIVSTFTGLPPSDSTPRIIDPAQRCSSCAVSFTRFSHHPRVFTCCNPPLTTIYNRHSSHSSRSRPAFAHFCFGQKSLSSQSQQNGVARIWQISWAGYVARFWQVSRTGYVAQEVFHAHFPCRVPGP